MKEIVSLVDAKGTLRNRLTVSRRRQRFGTSKHRRLAARTWIS